MGKEVLLIMMLGKLALTGTVPSQMGTCVHPIKGYLSLGGRTGCALFLQSNSTPPCYFLPQYPILLSHVSYHNTFIYVLSKYLYSSVDILLHKAGCNT